MGDPGDFALRCPAARIPKEVWSSLDSMAAIVERLLTHYGQDMNRPDLKARQKELANAHRMLDKYRTRQEDPKKKPLQGVSRNMLHALIAVGRWRCIGQDPLTAFEAIGAMFQKDTGFLRPGKSEPAECYYDGREEERQAAWKDWIKKKNKEIDEQIIAAIKKAAEG